MPVRKHRNSDNKDWPMIVEEVDQALFAYREYGFQDPLIDKPDVHELVDILGQALLAIAEHNRIDDTFVYGKYN